MAESLRDKVRLGLIWSAIQSWTFRLSSLGVFMVLARVLSPAEIGLYAMTTVILTFLSMLAEQGLSEAVVQRETITPQQMNTVFWLNISVAIFLTISVCLLAPFIASFMKQPELTRILQVSALVLPISAASFGQLAMRRRALDYKRIATATLASTFVGSAAVIAMVLAGFGVWSLVFQAIIGAVTFTLCLWFRPAWRLTRATDIRGLRPLIGYSSSRLSTYVLDFANNRYIEVFLAATLGPAALAVYTVGLKFYQALMQMFSSTILDVAHSSFSRLSQDRPALISAYYKSVAITATVAVPIFCMVAALAPSITIVLFGEKWIASAEVMRWTALLGAIQVMQFYNGTVYNAIGKPSIGLKFMVVKIILTFSTLTYFRDGEMTQLLYAYILSQLAITPASFYVLQVLVGISLIELWRRIQAMIFGCIAMMAIAMSAYHFLQGQQFPEIFKLIICSAAGGVGYIAFLFLFARQQLVEVFRLLRSRKS